MLALLALALAADTTPYANQVLLDPSGQATSLAKQASGDRLVVVVMKGHWCPVCLEQLGRLSARSEQLDALDAKVVGLNIDSPPANAGAMGWAGLPTPLLTDPTWAVIAPLGFQREGLEHPMPGLVVFDRCGEVRASQTGRSPGVVTEDAVIALLKELEEDPEECSRPAV